MNKNPTSRELTYNEAKALLAQMQGNTQNVEFGKDNSINQMTETNKLGELNENNRQTLKVKTANQKVENKNNLKK